MGDTIHHYNCVDGEWFHAGDCPGCEIKSLRAELAEKDELIGELKKAEDVLHKTIVELEIRCENAEAGVTMYESMMRFEKMKERIEELEKAAHFGDPCIYCGIPHDDVPPGPCRGPRITTEQIDKAWNRIRVLRNLGDDGGASAIEELLADTFHIVACEECGGSGEGGMRYDGSPVPIEEPCFDCNGHGWVVKE